MAEVDSTNVCCPDLAVASCADTEEHKHLVCGDSGAVLGNSTIASICLGKWRGCVLWTDHEQEGT